MPHDRFSPIGWGAVILKEKLPVLFGREEPWSDGVNPYSVGSPFPRQKLAQTDHGCFGGRVRHHLGEWNMGGNACDIDDASLFPLEHSRAEDLTRQKGSANKIEIEVLLPS